DPAAEAPAANGVPPASVDRTASITPLRTSTSCVPMKRCPSKTCAPVMTSVSVTRYLLDRRRSAGAASPAAETAQPVPHTKLESTDVEGALDGLLVVLRRRHTDEEISGDLVRVL